MTARAKYLRFSLRSLFIGLTVVAVAFGAWVVKSQMRVRALESLRDQGTIVRLRHNPPKWLKPLIRVGTGPLFVEPFVIELYVTPVPGGARLGDSDEVLSTEDAKLRLLEQQAEAERLGAKDIQLGVIGDSSEPDFFDWLRFGTDNRMPPISEGFTRYTLRLAANRENGANINPAPSPRSQAAPTLVGPPLAE